MTPWTYHAVIYLLSHDPEVCAAACRYISVDSFIGLKQAIRDFDDRTRQVVDIAHNLFSRNSPWKATPLSHLAARLSLHELIYNAYYIDAGEYQVVIEAQKGEITLDDRHYRERKRIYQQLEHMERAVAPQI